MKRSLFLVINSLNGGGAEHAAARLSQEFDKYYELVVISLMPFTDNDYAFSGKCISINEDYVGKTWFSKIKKASKRIEKMTEEYNPVAVISFLQNANLCVALSNIKTKKILSIRNNIDMQYSGVKHLIWQLLIKRYFKRATYIVSVTSGINEIMAAKYGMPREKCKYIYNPYDALKLQSEAQDSLCGKEQSFFDNHIVISNMGHISLQKGQFHLIRILIELRKNDNYGLVIIGNCDTEYGEKIKDLIRSNKLENHVLLTGCQNNPYKYLAKSNCYVLSSLYEGCPNALVEAMICGVPVIAADCVSGPREILVKDGVTCGFLVENDLTAWMDMNVPLMPQETHIIKDIQILNEDSLVRQDYINKALERAQDFSIDCIIKQWIELL